MIPLVLLALVLITVISSSHGGSKDPELATEPVKVTPAPVASTGPAPAVSPVPSSAAPAPTPAAPGTTVSQRNALAKAEDYLATMPFSRQGLINQLTSQFDGFSVSDATYAVDNVKVDWNEQAAKKAKQYLASMHFSHAGLVQQLTSQFDGFTPEQAEYGVSQNGL